MKPGVDLLIFFSIMLDFQADFYPTVSMQWSNLRLCCSRSCVPALENLVCAHLLLPLIHRQPSEPGFSRLGFFGFCDLVGARAYEFMPPPGSRNV